MADINAWMNLVRIVSCNFPGLETENEIKEYENTVLKFINKKQAICVKSKNNIIRVLLFSRSHNMICCLAVSSEYRKRGIASSLIEFALNELDKSKDITVSTYRKDDEKDTVPRALYKKYGFVEDEQQNIIIQIKC